MIQALTGELLDSVLDDAADRMRGGNPVLDRKQMAVYCWPQRWPNSSCGFGGVGMQAYWTAPTICVVAPEGDIAVYHKGRFVAHLYRPSDEFARRFQAFDLPGATEADWWAAQELSPPMSDAEGPTP
jgi:hypothetical protein